MGLQLHWAVTKSINRPCRPLRNPQSNAPQTFELLFLRCDFNNSLVVLSYSSWLLRKDEKSDSSLFRLEDRNPALHFLPRLEERNNAETINSALMWAVLPIELLACSRLDDGHKGQGLGWKGHSLVCCCCGKGPAASWAQGTRLWHVCSWSESVLHPVDQHTHHVTPQTDWHLGIIDLLQSSMHTYTTNHPLSPCLYLYGDKQALPNGKLFHFEDI